MSILLLLALLPQDAPAQTDAPVTVIDATPFGLERTQSNLLAPAGALGGGLMMSQGEWAFSLDFSEQTYDGLRDGTGQVDSATVLTTWATTVEDARMNSWNLEARWGLTDRITCSQTQTGRCTCHQLLHIGQSGVRVQDAATHLQCCALAPAPSRRVCAHGAPPLRPPLRS